MPRKPDSTDRWARRVEQYISYVSETNSFRRDYIDLCNLQRSGIRVKDAYRDYRTSC